MVTVPRVGRSVHRTGGNMGIMKEENMGVTKERGSLGGTSGTESPRVPRAGHAPPAASRAADIGAPFDE